MRFKIVKEAASSPLYVKVPTSLVLNVFFMYEPSSVAAGSSAFSVVSLKYVSPLNVALLSFFSLFTSLSALPLKFMSAYFISSGLCVLNSIDSIVKGCLSFF